MEPDGIDILDYWKRNETAYPTLVMMARDIFAVPVSTVHSESCFSLANKILTDKTQQIGCKDIRTTRMLEKNYNPYFSSIYNP
jgi:hAT family C-terminal dimerisation region